MKKSVKRALGLTALAGASYAVWRAYSQRRVTAPGSRPLEWEAQPFPYPPQPASIPVPEAAATTSAAPWVEPLDDGACPVGHPVKAKVASGIYHVEGGANYARTRADRCYSSPEAAEADGLRAAKR
jgi:hypothetical protein